MCAWVCKCVCVCVRVCVLVGVTSYIDGVRMKEKRETECKVRRKKCRPNADWVKGECEGKE